MATITDIKDLYVGDVPAQSVYLGSSQIWIRPPAYDPNIPNEISGLVTWLDGPDYTPGYWVNKGSGAPVSIVGSPVMAQGPRVNGHTVVRFKVTEGRVRGTWPYPIDDWTVLYVMRWIGPSVGRAWTVCYPPSNLLIGTHTTGQDTAYLNGAWLGPNPGSQVPWGTGPGTWKMYEGDSDSASATVGFYINGVDYGRYTSGSNLGLTNGWGLSGYDPVGTQETMDIDVAEMVLYNRRLTFGERRTVEDYLRTKWGIPTPPGVYDPDTTAYLAATGLDPSYGEPLNDLVIGLKSHGLWSKMSAVYPFVGGTAALHKWNLMDPRDSDNAYRLTYYNAPSTTHSTALGYRANAQGQQANGGYADTHFVPLGGLTQNSTHLSWYSTEDTPPGDRAEFGAFNWGGMATSRFHIIARYQGVNAYYYGQSENASTNVPSPAASGLFVTSRTGPTTTTPYRNGVSLGSSNQPSVTLPDRPLWLGAINDFVNRSDIPCGFASIGSGLDATNVTDLYNIVQAFQTDLGRQV